MSNLCPRLALRIGLAARALPSVTPAHLVHVLIGALKLPLTDQKLKGLTLQQLRTAASSSLRSVPVKRLETALLYLRDRAAVDILDPAIPKSQPYRDGDLPGSVRIAIASDRGLLLDGQFGECIRFLVYQVSPSSTRLIAVRGTAGDRGAPDRHAWRAQLIRDCRIVFVPGIGIRGHSHLVHNGAYVVRHPRVGAAADALADLQQVLDEGPPPWLARIARAPAANPVIAPTLASGLQDLRSYSGA
jgi:nitrogen fixation protein NifX